MENFSSIDKKLIENWLEEEKMLIFKVGIFLIYMEDMKKKMIYLGIIKILLNNI